MDNQRHAAAMSDADFDRELARALAVDPSPEFTARLRTRIASEPAPRSVFVQWRFVALGATAAVIALAVVVSNRSNRSEPAPIAALLTARATIGASSLPYLGSAFLTAEASAKAVRRTAAGPAEAGLPVLPMLDPRETAALRTLLAGVRDNRVDLAPLLQPGTPSAMDLPPVTDLVIAPIAIEPLAPDTGAQDPVSRSGQGERQ